jgi:hypothetical protein
MSSVKAIRSDDVLYADFRSLRHWFITRPARAGISPKMAQTLARHSDVRLTLGLYAHVTRHDQTAAIESRPSPPAGKDGTKAGGRPRRGREGRRGRKDSAA